MALLNLRPATVEMVRALLKAGADPNPFGTVSFHGALDDPNAVTLGIFLQLLDHGAKLEAADESGQTALMHAATFGNWRAMNILLQRGADRNAKDQDGKTAAITTRRNSVRWNARLRRSIRNGRRLPRDCDRLVELHY